MTLNSNFSCNKDGIRINNETIINTKVWINFTSVIINKTKLYLGDINVNSKSTTVYDSNNNILWSREPSIYIDFTGLYKNISFVVTNNIQKKDINLNEIFGSNFYNGDILFKENELLINSKNKLDKSNVWLNVSSIVLNITNIQMSDSNYEKYIMLKDKYKKEILRNSSQNSSLNNFLFNLIIIAIAVLFNNFLMYNM